MRLFWLLPIFALTCSEPSESGPAVTPIPTATEESPLPDLHGNYTTNVSITWEDQNGSGVDEKTRLPFTVSQNDSAVIWWGLNGLLRETGLVELDNEYRVYITYDLRRYADVGIRGTASLLGADFTVYIVEYGPADDQNPDSEIVEYGWLNQHYTMRDLKRIPGYGE